MSIYEDILPLSEVKNDLRIDECFKDDDSAIERMIASSFDYISKRCNHVFRLQNKTYHSDISTGNIIIYDHPIKTNIFNDGVFPIHGSKYIKFCNTRSITISVGYESREEVPMDLVEAALRLIKDMYYNSEEKNLRGLTVTDDINKLIDPHRRFTI